MRRALYLAFAIGAALGAHPMGNFSVNHYARLHFGGQGARLTYVLDLAEIPTFELMQQWGVDLKNQAGLDRKAREEAATWLAGVSLTQGGHPAALRVLSVSAKTAEGAGGMPILRIEIVAEAKLRAGAVDYEDGNFKGRAGWKEIVVDGDSSARIVSSSQAGKDLSAALTRYPGDPGITPPQDLTARVDWAPVGRVAVKGERESGTGGSRADVGVRPTGAFSTLQPKAAGTVVAGDFLSRLLRRRQIGWDLILLGVLAAFGLGAMHAMSPGHGKTIVAAYLVGSRGTLKHAGILGSVVTFTHTCTVFLLGLGVLFFQQYVVPEKITPVLGAISGLSIVAVGAMLLYRRGKALMGGGHGHGHGHGHHHGEHERRDESRRGTQECVRYGGHSHAVPERVTMGSLIALGISGGLVPCPSALILMLSAIALGRPGVGLILLVGFSMGLAAVLMGIGVLAVYAKHLLPKSETTMQRPLFRLIPVFSAVVVICLGLAMTAVSAGWTA